jgi:hypothetical protein
MIVIDWSIYKFAVKMREFWRSFRSFQSDSGRPKRKLEAGMRIVDYVNIFRDFVDASLDISDVTLIISIIT